MENLLNDLNDYLQTGFSQINALQGLLIALGAAYFLQSWAGVFIVAAGATVVHVIADVMIPVLAKSAEFKLPPLVEGDYWKYLFALYVGYVVVITAFYVVKRVVLRAQHQAA